MQTTLYLQGRGRTAILAQAARGCEEGLASHFVSFLKALPAQRCELQIVLDDALAKFWSVEPPVNTAQFDDLGAAARIRFEALYDLPISEWVIQAHWNATAPFLACAVPVGLLAVLSGCLNSSQYQHVKVVGCVPSFIHCWNSHQPHMPRSMQGFGTVGAATVTVAFVQNAKLLEVRCLPLASLEPLALQRADQAVQNLGLQLGLKIPADVWLAGNLPAQWTVCKTDRIQWRRLGGRGGA